MIDFEASDRLGGQRNIASLGVTRRQIAGVADWLIQEVDLSGVDLRLNHYLEAADVIAEAPDEVVVATGGWPDRAIAHDPGPTCSSVVLRDLALQNVTFQCFHELVSLETDGNHKKATLRHVLTDAIANRNIHAAPYDALRVCKDI